MNVFDRPQLNRDKFIGPLYAQIKMVLQAEIEQHMSPGDAVPTEPQLEERFQVSRITIRRAMDELESEGVIVRMQGKGTFVARDRIRQRTPLISWSRVLEHMGHDTATVETAIDIVSVAARIAQMLDCPERTAVARIRRLKVAAGEPVCLITNYMSDRYSDLVRNGLRDDSIYATLAAAGISPEFAEDTIEARCATSSEAEKLGVAENSPVLQITRLVYGTNRQPLYVAVVANRADRVSYVMSVAEGKER